jgi:GT2 family glycosyltransferase
MNPLRVSVCIANYNGMAVIDACLRSVLDQDCDFPVEIIVHDDASTDGSLQYVQDHWPQAKLIASPENVGFCISNNRMVAAAQGEYVLLLNNDAELFPNALRSLMTAAERLGKPAILGLPQYDAADGHLIDRGSLFDPFLNPIPNLDLNREDVGMVMGACLWIPRGLWDKIGGFPEWFGSMAEDMYVCCVARLWGFQVRVLPESGFRHWVGHSFGGGKVTGGKRLMTTMKRRSLSEKNKTSVMIMTYPSPVMAILLWPHLLLLILEGVLLSLLKPDKALWRHIYAPCLASIWFGRQRLWTARHSVQMLRVLACREFFRPFTPIPHKLTMLARHGLPQVK